ncbi:MAG: DNA-binding response regulator, OmpR family, contains REC and winged-helix (wHTH) domain [Pelagibacterales bacterium]|nr:DNA-binding response regulator, OmpR family, contains REC and winged-helix (wHTH) domain [Pelagibacterales bacterium]
MFKHNIYIVEFKELYNILKEIEVDLPFNLNYFSKEDKFFQLIDNNEFENKNFLILTKIDYKNNFLKKNIINDKKIIFLSPKKKTSKIDNNFISFIYPIKIFDLIEKINIQLIKQKYNYQSKINISKYSLDINSRIISTNNNILKLTEREIDIILFLKDSKIPQKISNLQNKVWGYSTNIETHTVETHIYRLRKKINDIFNDDHFITSNDEGYFIL